MKIVPIFLGLATLTASFAQAGVTVFFDDFTSSTYSDKAGGDVYPADFDFSDWRGLSSSINGSDQLVVNNHASATDTRGAGHMISASELGIYGAGYTFDLNFTIADIHNNANTRLYVTVWEAKEGPTGGLYYLDMLAPLTTPPSVKTWGDATFSELGSMTFSNADASGATTVVNGTTYSLTGLTRTDHSADLVIMFSVSKTTNFSNSAFIADVELTAVPEPSTYALIGGLIALVFVIRRRRK